MHELFIAEKIVEILFDESILRLLSMCLINEFNGLLLLRDANSLLDIIF